MPQSFLYLVPSWAQKLQHLGEYVHTYHLCSLNLDSFADNFVCEGGDEKKQHPRTGCDWVNLVQCNEHCGVEQKRGACSRASHQALEG